MCPPCCAHPRCRSKSRAIRNSPRGAPTVAAMISLLAPAMVATLTGIEAWRLPDPLLPPRKRGASTAPRHLASEYGRRGDCRCARTVAALPLAYAIYRSRLLAAAVEPLPWEQICAPPATIAPHSRAVMGTVSPYHRAVRTDGIFSRRFQRVVGLRHIDHERWKLPRSTVRRVDDGRTHGVALPPAILRLRNGLLCLHAVVGRWSWRSGLRSGTHRNEKQRGHRRHVRRHRDPVHHGNSFCTSSRKSSSGRSATPSRSEGDIPEVLITVRDRYRCQRSRLRWLHAQQPGATQSGASEAARTSRSPRPT